jgi:hypothetical protein
MPFIRFPWLAAAAALTTMCAGAAHAGDVHWSVGIQAPIGPGVSVGTVISNRHVFVAPAPVVYAPAPVVYAPPPYAPVAYAPGPVWAPRRVVYGAPIWVGGRWADPHHVHAAPVWHDRHGPPHFDPRRSPGREIRY